MNEILRKQTSARESYRLMCALHVLPEITGPVPALALKNSFLSAPRSEMRIPIFITVILIAVLCTPNVSAWSGKPVLLTSVETITLKSGLLTAANRVAPVPQVRICYIWHRYFQKVASLRLLSSYQLFSDSTFNFHSSNVLVVLHRV